MTEIMIRLEQTEQEFVAFDVSDEALEAAAGTVKEKAANYTLAACSGLSVCPA
jgi:methylase of polypeptide subunit release factors